MLELKKCSDCGQYRPLGQFSKRTLSKDGLAPRCKTCHRTRCKIWREKNKEYKNAWDRGYSSRNRVAILQRIGRWRKTRRGKDSRLMEHYRRKNIGPIDLRTIAKVISDAKGLCHYCGKVVNQNDRRFGDGATIDHVKPISKGGTNDPSNLVLSCRSCNSKKGNRTP